MWYRKLENHLMKSSRHLIIMIMLLPLPVMAIETVARIPQQKEPIHRPLYPICGPKDYLTTDPLTARPLCKRLICEANQYLTTVGGVPSCKTIPTCGASQFLTFNNNAFVCVAYIAPPPSFVSGGHGGGGGQTRGHTDSGARNGQGGSH